MTEPAVCDDDVVVAASDDAAEIAGPQLPVYEIHADRIGELETRIDKANRRLARAGSSERFTYTAEPFTREVSSNGGIAQYIPMQRITLSAPEITVPGYTFVAGLTREEGGMIVRTAPGQNLDGWTRPEDHHCDYCGKTRHRSTSYVVRKDATGEIIQIGKSCLRPFLGVTPAGLWTLTLAPEELLPAGEDSGYFGGRIPVVYPIRQLLAMAWAVSDGGTKFITATQARDSWKPISSTGQIALYVWHWEPIGRNAEKERPYIDAMRAAATQVSDDIVDELLAGAQTLDPNHDYGANMAAALAGENVTARSVGLVVSLIAVRNRVLRKDAEVKAHAQAVAASEWIGQPKDKLTDLEVTVQTVLYVDGYSYNSTDTIVVMRTADGHVLKWKASGRHNEIEQGASYHLDRATVKEHGEYRGIKQTTVIRCKLTPVAEAAA
ncbi:hypothetical protein [Mycolicibacterium alvei]|uniref:Uncharacterized protein n=1 Tax=Mycolicibacterium alvei TaxID=67081 RepID=A0A6N4V492_9MYCO|nr:hypothetical protein [Mycolicibacterium alvei]MCV7003582.1 hypothetical protein [Mycolicibacterium alvei]BBX30461.1 hypothetical protein MALV_55860 [Mycolicibacterium alvei]